MINFTLSSSPIFQQGIHLFQTGQLQAALKLWQQLQRKCQQTGNRYQEANLLNALGNTYNALGYYQDALNSHQHQLTITQEINDSLGESKAQTGLGNTYYALGEHHKAIDCHQKALAVTQNIKDNLGEAIALGNLGNVYCSLGQYLKAIEYHQRALSMFQVSGDRLGEVNSLGNLGNALVDLEPPSGNQRSSLGSLSDLVLELYKILNPDIKDKAVSEATNHQENFSSNSISIISKQLYQLLIQPISHLLPTSPDVPVIFIPQDFLFVLPLPTLQDAEGKFLLEKHTIITAPSIQVLELTQKRSQETQQTSLDALVVGNPKMPTIPLTEPPVQLEDLAWAKTEAQAIAPLLKTQAITGVAATKVYIKQQMTKAGIIHLATHGLLDDIRQLGVPGAIALTPTQKDNGFLTASEILEMQLNAQLVVLSACSTGRGKMTGDGVIGLSRSLIAAGVNSVIVSLWSVGDQSTAFLMVKFYQNLQQGMIAAVALNQAQRWLLRVTKLEMEAWLEANQDVLSHTLRISLRRQMNKLKPDDRPFEHPQHWAAFCAIGK